MWGEGGEVRKGKESLVELESLDGGEPDPTNLGDRGHLADELGERAGGIPGGPPESWNHAIGAFPVASFRHFDEASGFPEMAVERKRGRMRAGGRMGGMGRKAETAGKEGDGRGFFAAGKEADPFFLGKPY
ncbi:MAG: hypothetical protein ACYTHN_17535, partial [Planctomycetota bacterium]